MEVSPAFVVILRPRFAHQSRSGLPQSSLYMDLSEGGTDSWKLCCAEPRFIEFELLCAPGDVSKQSQLAIVAGGRLRLRLGCFF